MARANDEPDAMYGLAAKSVRISPDKLTYRFTLRPEARFHDGSKMTAHDVAFSLNTLKEKGHPLIVVQLRDMVKAEALDDATVAVTFAPNRARDVPLYVAGLPIFSKAYYATRPFEESTTRYPARLGAVQGRQVRDQPLHRIRPGQGLVGRPIFPSTAAATISIPCATSSIATATSRSKALPARIISTARNSRRGSGRRATIFPRSRTAGSSARPCRMNCRRVRRAGSSTPAASKFKDPQGPRSGHQCVRFRMDQQDRDVRRLCAHGLAVPEFGHGGDRAAVAGRAEAARAVPRQGAGRSVRRAVRAAGVGWLGAGPRLAAQGRAVAAATPDSSSRTASGCCRTARSSRSNSCSTSPRSSRITRPSSRISALLGIEATIRLVDAVQYRARVEDFDFDMTDDAPQHVADAGRQPASVLLLAGGGDQGLVQSGRESPIPPSMRWSTRPSAPIPAPI